MATFAERLTEALRIRHMTAAELARILNINEGTISQYKNGLYEPKQRRTQQIAKALNVSIDWLMGADMPFASYSSPNLSSVPDEKVFPIPVFDSVSAGFSAIAQDSIIEYKHTYINTPSEKDKFIWVNVIGDSMAPKIENGDKLLIRKQESVDSGQVAVVLIDGEQAAVKKVVYGKDWIELQSFNPYFPPRRFEGSDVQKIRVLGIVKEVNKVFA